MIIEHDNILYMTDIPQIGGTSTYVLEMVKKYKDLDIAIVCKSIDFDFARKLWNYCKVYQLNPEDQVKCKVCIINYDTSMLDQIEADDIIMVVHGDYANENYEQYPDFKHPKITKVISLTQHLQKSLKEHFDVDSEVHFNPLSVENKKPLVLLSATRLSKVKGKDRMIKLGEALNKAEVDYIWYVFTDDEEEINNPNIIYMKPRTDIGSFMIFADYVVQLSDTEALSYTINEALYRNIPVIVTPLPYLDEIGVKDGVNAYILEFDCSNVEDIAKKITKKPKFKFEQIEDGYEKVLHKGKSKFQKELKTPEEVKCIQIFWDLEALKWREEGEIWTTNKVRADYLRSINKVG